MYSYSFINGNDNSSHNFSNIFSMDSASGGSSNNNNNNNNNLFQNIPSQLLRNNNNNNNSGLYSTEENSRTQLFNLTQADSDES